MTSAADLHVWDAPVFPVVPPTVIVDPQTDFTFSCVTVGDPRPTLEVSAALIDQTSVAVVFAILSFFLMRDSLYSCCFHWNVVVERRRVAQ